MHSKNNLLNEIELLRKKMSYVAVNKGYTDIESVELSQQLDELLNAYESLKDNHSREERN